MAGAAEVLIVEDDDELRELMVELFLGHHFRVLGLSGGEAALAYLEAHPPPRAILLDMMMTPMDGLEFLAELHKRPQLRELPVLVCTASQQFGRQPPDGARQVFLKPLDLDVLVATIERLVRGG